MDADLAEYKKAFPRAHTKRKGNYTKKLQKWMKQRVKDNKTDILWTQPHLIYNESTGRFIQGDSKMFFDRRSKTKKLKKKLQNEYVATD